jgi:hypothetical protein
MTRGCVDEKGGQERGGRVGTIALYPSAQGGR